MTDEKLIFSLIEQLPETSKLKVQLYIKTLINNTEPEISIKPNPRKSGHSKGKYQIREDFDEPLEEFQDYAPCDTSSTPTRSFGLPLKTND